MLRRIMRSYAPEKAAKILAAGNAAILGEPFQPVETGGEYTSRPTRARLAAVYLACVHVAAKNVDTVPYRCLLATMLANLCGVEGVSPAAAAALELDVLVGLGWRLGPFFSPAVEVAYK